MFLIGGVMFAIASTLTVVSMATGEDRIYLHLGEAFIAAGWIAPLVGLLGLLPGLVEENRWLTRAGGAFAGVGVVAFVILGLISLYAFFAGARIEDLPIVFVLPGIFVGSLLAFVSFSVATLRTTGHSRTLGGLLLVPSLVFVTNLFVLPAVLGSGPNPPEVGFALTSLLAVAMLAIGYVRRSEPVPRGRSEPIADTS